MANVTILLLIETVGKRLHQYKKKTNESRPQPPAVFPYPNKEMQYRSDKQTWMITYGAASPVITYDMLMRRDICLREFHSAEWRESRYTGESGS